MNKAPARGALLGLAIAVAGTLGAPEASACGYSDDVMFTASVHPDLPLNRFAAGRLGIVKGDFARSYLTVAYRWLAGPSLDPKEQAGAMQLWRSRLPVEPSMVDTSIPPPTPGSTPAAVSAPWDRARAAALGLPTSGPVPNTISQSYAVVDNCLPDAFVTAARTLDDRVARFGKDSKRVKRWLSAQDRVFNNCSGTPALVPPLIDPVDALESEDRAYQIAASQFYAGALGDAEQGFRAIGADRSSPWRPLARLAVVRALVRQAMAGPAPDKTILLRASRELTAILADPSLQPVHGAARRYQGIVSARLQPPGLATAYAVRIARGGLGDDFFQVANDYTWALDADPAPLAPTAPDADRLSAWLGVMQGANPAAFDRAEHLFSQSHSPAWLVAALAKAEPSLGARLDPLLHDAGAIDATSPAYATLQFHRFRLLLARGAGSLRYADIDAARAKMGPDAGPSTLNALKPMALQAAPDLAALLKESHALPAGVSSVDEPVAVPYTATAGTTLADHEMFYAEGADTLTFRLPLARLAQAAQANSLPRHLRAQLSTAVFVRAVLLGDLAVARRVAPVTAADDPALRGYVQAVLASRDAAHRRLALLVMLLEAPNASWAVPSWRTDVAAPAPIDTSYGGYWWCGSATSATPPGFAVSFLSAAEKKTVERESAALAALGTGPTFLASEAVRLADLLPSDPRVPQTLHLAVRATRYGCKDQGTTPASRRAFQTLHAKYPKSVWADRTPYYY